MGILAQLSSDFRTGRKVIRNGLRARRMRREAAVRDAEVAHPTPGTIHVGLYFADPRVNLYQIRQWYAPLAELAKTHPVAIIARNAGSSIVLRGETDLPVLYLRTMTEVEGFLADQDLRIMFYVNQNIKNFQMLRYGRMWHVFISHGESDKAYMTSNQFKSYDYAFVAGQAALDRLSQKLWDYDLEKRAIPIGRPQADYLIGEVPFEPDGRTVVFYSPTWEGDRPSMAYGSVASHGPAIAAAVLGSPDHRLIYRPHPRSGVMDREYREANRRIIAAIEAANAADPSAHHVYDDGGDLGWQLAVADVAVTDISAMIYDRLATGKPIIVTRPASADAEVDEQGYLGAAEWLDADRADDVLAFADRLLNDPEARSVLAHWAEHYFGDTTPGTATRRFHEAVEHLIAEWERHAAIHAGDPRLSQTDPLDDDEDEDALPPAE